MRPVSLCSSAPSSFRGDLILRASQFPFRVISAHAGPGFASLPSSSCPPGPFFFLSARVVFLHSPILRCSLPVLSGLSRARAPHVHFTSRRAFVIIPQVALVRSFTRSLFAFPLIAGAPALAISGFSLGGVGARARSLLGSPQHVVVSSSSAGSPMSSIRWRPLVCGCARYSMAYVSQLWLPSATVLFPLVWGCSSFEISRHSAGCCEFRLAFGVRAL